MTLEQFRDSLKDPVPPGPLSPTLCALWWEAKGDWSRGHEIAQSEEKSESAREAAWAHAYLHRKEGDAENAGYWYRYAGQPFPQSTLNEEWEQIVSAFLDRQNT